MASESVIRVTLIYCIDEILYLLGLNWKKNKIVLATYS